MLPLSRPLILFSLPDGSYAETETYFQEITSIAQSCNLGLIKVIYNSHALYMQVGLTCYLTQRSSSLAQCALQENLLDHREDALMVSGLFPETQKQSSQMYFFDFDFLNSTWYTTLSE